MKAFGREENGGAVHLSDRHTNGDGLVRNKGEGVVGEKHTFKERRRRGERDKEIGGGRERREREREREV